MILLFYFLLEKLEKTLQKQEPILFYFIGQEIKKFLFNILNIVW